MQTNQTAVRCVIMRGGTSKGVFPVKVRFDQQGNVLEASYSRTARRLMEGTVYVSRNILKGV